MKFLLFVCCLLPLYGQSQTMSDYNNALKSFEQLYNAGKDDSINAMFGHVWDKTKGQGRALWPKGQSATLLKEYGSLKSFKFLGRDTQDPDSVYVFKTVFSIAGEKTTSLTLDKNKQFGDFRFITSSDGIDELLKKEKKR